MRNDIELNKPLSTPRGAVVLILLGMSFYFYVNFLKVSIPGSVFDNLQIDFDISAAKVTFFGSIFMYTYGTVQLVVGLLADRFGGFKVILCGFALLVLTSLLFPFCSNYYVALGARLLVGVAAGTIYLSLVREITFAFPKNYMFMLGTSSMVGFSGAVVSGTPLIWALSRWNWRAIYTALGLFFGALYVIYAICYSRLAKSRPQNDKPVEPFRWSKLFDVCKNRCNLYLTLCGGSFTSFFVINSIIGRKFLQDFCCQSDLAVGWNMSAISLCSCCSGMLAAILCRKLRDNAILVLKISASFTASMFAVVLFCVIFDWHSPYLGIPTFFTGVLAGISPVWVMIVKTYNPQSMLTTSMSVLNFVSYMSVGVAANLAGKALELFPARKDFISGALIYGRNSWIAVMIVLLAIVLISVFFACLLERDVRSGKIREV